MTVDYFKQLILTNEPILTYNGIQYQICAVSKGYLIGLADTEENDRIFETVDELLEEYIVEGNCFKDILKDIENIE